MVSIRRISVVAAVGAVAMALAACSSQASTTTPNSGATSGASIKTGPFGGQELANGKPVEGGTFTYGLFGPVQGLDPAQVMGNSILFAESEVYGGLMKLQPDGGVAPDLADSLTASNNSTVWTLKLPANLKFTDGTAFDAQAVIDHEKNVAAPGSTSTQAKNARQIVSMTAPDAQTVVFKLSAPNNQFGLLLADNSMSMIPSPTAKASEGANFALKPVGAGPFKVDSIKPGSEIDLSKNTSYKFASEGLPYLSNVKLITNTDESSRISGVKSGSLDATVVSNIPNLKTAESEGLTGLEEPSYQAEILTLNNKVLSNLKLRKAISEAIDRNAINQAVYQGEHSAMSGFLAPSQPNAKGQPKLPSYNLAHAKKDMKSSGVGDMTLTVLTTPGDDGNQIAQVVKQMLAKIGITVVIKPTDPTTQVGMYAQGNYQASITPKQTPAETTTTLDEYYGTGSTRNFSETNLSEFDALATKAASASTDAARKAIIPQELKVLTDNVVAVPLVTTGAGRVLGPRVMGFPDGNPDRGNVEPFDLSTVWVKK